MSLRSTQLRRIPSHLTGSSNISRRPICHPSARRSQPLTTRAIPKAKSQPTKNLRYSLMGFLSLTPIIYYFYPQSPSNISPQIYTSQKLNSTTKITPKHVLLTIPIPPSSTSQFSSAAVKNDGSSIDIAKGEIAIQHVMIKSPDLQIERPYTPLNDVAKDGEVRLLVKRNKGGEVGRLIHSKQAGEEIGIRGPITTFTLAPNEYDKIVMISTGTAIAPYLQLLSKLPSATTSRTSYHLIHSLPLPLSFSSATPQSTSLPIQKDTNDIAVQSQVLPAIQQKMGERLIVHRPPFGVESMISNVKDVVGGFDIKKEKVLVLVCLPDSMMKPLCGTLTPTLQQGPITGYLKEMGLDNSHVWKLE